MNAMAATYRDFPIFWWNFLIVEGQPKWDDLETYCVELHHTSGSDIQKLPCQFELKNLKNMTHDWIGDVPLRQNLSPPSTWNMKLDEALAKASLPISRDLLEILRVDPLNTLTELKQKIEKRMQLDFKLQRGFLVDQKSNLILMPIQMSFSPADSQRTQKFSERLSAGCGKISGCTRLTMFGPHASSQENEMQIHRDVDTVSKVGLLALTILILFIIGSRRYQVLSLLPLLLLSIGTSVVVTILVFGKIHGITLAFGPGIIGLAMDYGIHSCFLGPRSIKTWRANWVGLWTTLVSMVILGCSSVPLLRQMMFFAVFGLVLSFLLFYYFLRRWPSWFEAKTYSFTPQNWNLLNGLSVLFIFSSLLIFFKPIHLGIQQLNFETLKTVELRKWFFNATSVTSPYLIIEDPADPLSSSLRALQWSAQHQLTYEGIGNYLPSVAVQAQNLISWREAFCPLIQLPLDLKKSLFFKPFLDSIACEKLAPNDLTHRIPTYLGDFHHDQQFVGLLFPKNPNEIRMVKEQFPDASTPREIFDNFPRIFYAELLWMIPLAFFSALVFLWRHYMSVSHALLAIVPFLTGLGCFVLVSFSANLSISFISMIGLLMVFGCSLDYGVFVMDFLLFRDKHERGVWSALTLCCLATLAGFAPLVFAQHPVLNDLGHALLWGSLGTYIGSLWGVPTVYRFLNRWSHH